MITVAEFCEQAGLPVSSVFDLYEALRRSELMDLARKNAEVLRQGRNGHDVVPLEDEQGNEIGRVEARIPKFKLFNFAQRKGIGWENVLEDEVIKDVLRDNPECRTRQVSRKITVGWTPGRKVVKRYQFEEKR